jgi:phage tail-like protein
MAGALNENAVSALAGQKTFVAASTGRLHVSRRHLSGLAVTSRDYLVVGDVTNRGLLLFDLRNAGNPTFQSWPGGVAFAPWDMAPAPGGGLLILDRDHGRYWALDCHLRLAAEVRDEEKSFQSVGARRNKRQVREHVYPCGYPLKGEDGAPLRFPISIEPGPDGHVLVLETVEQKDTQQIESTIYEYDGAKLIQAYHLADDSNKVEIMDPTVGEGIIDFYAVVGHDFAYVEDGGDAAQVPNGCNCIDTAGVSSASLRHMIYVADYLGKQVFGFRIDAQQQRLRDERMFLPLRRWGKRGIVTAGGQVHYDFQDARDGQQQDVRWTQLMAYAECHYVGLAVLYTTTNFALSGGDSFSSNVSGRAVVPALSCPPPPTPIAGSPFDSNIDGCTWHRLLLDAQIPSGTDISIRAHAADDPVLLQFANWIEQPALYLRSGGAELPFYYPWRDLQPLPERTGTWEILFQRIRGRYIQLELTISGAGRATPAIRALRAWYPRFFYLEHYLPAIYQEDPLWSSFLDRWLANFEGLYTNLENKIEHAAELFDPRAAPAEFLEWLACWFGLLLDPLWDEARRRLLIRHIDQLYRRRGTAFGIEIAVRLYLDPVVCDSLFDPTYQGTGTVRIVEQFAANNSVVPSNAIADAYQRALQSAYQFSVLAPHDLTDEQLDMVRRLIELEKPAHTGFTLGRYWDNFNVGAARLGQDTSLGESSLTTQQPLGESSLGDTYLDIPYPVSVPDRIVLGRDDLGAGQLPAL